MSKKQKSSLIRCILALVLVIVIISITKFIDTAWWVELLCYMVPYLVIGYDVLFRAARNIKNGQVFDECFLMSIATIGAIATGEYLEGVAVMLFYQIGELFQGIAVGKSRKNIADLMDICPEVAYVLGEDGSVTETDPDEVQVGSLIVVNAGEKVPIDGLVVEGESSLDTSALTGESVPRMIKEGQQVISGCIALSGRIIVRTEKEFEDSTVSRILELVENSSMRKAKAENFISKFAKYYTPIVVYSAIALFVLPPIVRLIMGLPAMWTVWLMRALTFLVISCPCAVVISVPLSFFGGIGCASSRGILVKGSNYLEILSDCGVIVFDKTGTLTKGVFDVQGVYPAKSISADYLLDRAAHVESSSKHPIAESILRAYKKEFGSEINYNLIYGVEEIAGHGISANIKSDENSEVQGRYEDIGSKRVYAGNIRLMDMIGVKVAQPHDEGTVIYLAEKTIKGDEKESQIISGQTAYLGCIVISDCLKETSGAAIKGLSAQGIKTVMLTGDSKKAASQVAEKLGVSEVKAELLPQDKVSEVESLLASLPQGRRLAFVGDGINDAPVLARADIGIAMGAMGSDAAIEAADVVLMDDDPAKISLAMKISRKTLGIVRQNIIFAISVKVLCLILGALGVANMWVAIFADVGVMVIAVLNATRTLRIK